MIFVETFSVSIIFHFRLVISVFPLDSTSQNHPQSISSGHLHEYNTSFLSATLFLSFGLCLCLYLLIALPAIFFLASSYVISQLCMIPRVPSVDTQHGRKLNRWWGRQGDLTLCVCVCVSENVIWTAVSAVSLCGCISLCWLVDSNNSRSSI